MSRSLAVFAVFALALLVAACGGSETAPPDGRQLPDAVPGPHDLVDCNANWGPLTPTSGECERACADRSLIGGSACPSGYAYDDVHMTEVYCEGSFTVHGQWTGCCLREQDSDVGGTVAHYYRCE